MVCVVCWFVVVLCCLIGFCLLRGCICLYVLFMIVCLIVVCRGCEVVGWFGRVEFVRLFWLGCLSLVFVYVLCVLCVVLFVAR